MQNGFTTAGLALLDRVSHSIQKHPKRLTAALVAILMTGGGGAFAVASLGPDPVDLPVRDDLRTRLGWGHVFALQPLADGETRAALRRAADQRGILLPDEVIAHLLNHFERDMAHLMALLDRLDGFSLAEKRHITVPLLKKMLADEAPVP